MTMTETEARDLAVRITASWPGHPGVDISTWIDELRPLDCGTAGTTIVRLRRELERPPSIARFFTTYRSLNTASAAATETACLHCEGTGWVETTPLLKPSNREKPLRYSQHKPCTCAAGDQRRQSRVWLERRRPQQLELERAPEPAELF